MRTEHSPRRCFKQVVLVIALTCQHAVLQPAFAQTLQTSPPSGQASPLRVGDLRSNALTEFYFSIIRKECTGINAVYTRSSAVLLQAQNIMLQRALATCSKIDDQARHSLITDTHLADTAIALRKTHSEALASANATP